MKKNFAIFPVLDWIATLTTHIPNGGEQPVRYYGYYSNVSRGKRIKEKPKGEAEVAWKPKVINCCKSTCHFVVTRVVSTHGEENKEEARKR